jgi:hypothetical protein
MESDSLQDPARATCVQSTLLSFTETISNSDLGLSESESELLYNWRFTSNQFFQLNPCGYSPYLTSSLTIGWVCRLEFLLVLIGEFILRSESRILLSQIRDSPNLEGQVPIFISPRNSVALLYPPGSGFPFRRLLRLAGLRWRYSKPPPHGYLGLYSYNVE